MVHDSKIAGKIKAQITRFSNRLTEGLTKPERRFIREVIYGIQATKDVKLSGNARSLDEAIPLIKTEWRLSRNAAKSDFTPRPLQAPDACLGIERPSHSVDDGCRCGMSRC